MQCAVSAMGACWWLIFSLMFMQLPRLFQVLVSTVEPVFWLLLLFYTLMGTPLPPGNCSVDGDFLS